jgi:hypothetical protein
MGVSWKTRLCCVGASTQTSINKVRKLTFLFLPSNIFSLLNLSSYRIHDCLKEMRLLVLLSSANSYLAENARELRAPRMPKRQETPSCFIQTSKYFFFCSVFARELLDI